MRDMNKAPIIHKLELKNFKKVKDEVFLFNRFDLIVGQNNSGKSTALQALAIWQYCVDIFRLNPRTGSSGIQVVLPNFTALPLPKFSLLWNDTLDRRYVDNSSKKSGKEQIYITIDIDVYWIGATGEEQHFCIQLRYHSPQALYAIPKEGWKKFKALDETETLPRIVYVPPFSGLEPHERWMDDGNVRQQVGKAQPGSVLRNLLFRMVDREGIKLKDNPDWTEIKEVIHDWFGVELLAPDYVKAMSTEIIVEFKQNKRDFDIIAGGSGFHQILTILAFLYGYPGISCVLFDEPDAHLHVNLQRKVVSYFKKKTDIQFLIATHSEEFVRNVEIAEVISIISGTPKRVNDTAVVLDAMSEVDNIDVLKTQADPFILYLEGEDDDRILAAWAETLGHTDTYQKFVSYILSGGSKKEMQERATRHFKALRQVVPSVKQAILLDRDNEDDAINPSPNQAVCNEWKRRNIDNYLLVSDAWKRAAEKELFGQAEGLFSELLTPVYGLIDTFFQGQNLILPPNTAWRTVNAEVFKNIDGKRFLFSKDDALYHQLKALPDLDLKLNRSAVAAAMTADEIHDDVHSFFANLQAIAKG